MMAGTLTRVANGTAYSSNNAMACYYTGEKKGEVWCAFQQNGTILLNAKFVISVNDGAGMGGVGTNGNTWAVSAHRLRTPTGTAVGLVDPTKSSEAKTESVEDASEGFSAIDFPPKE